MIHLLSSVQDFIFIVDPTFHLLRNVTGTTSLSAIIVSAPGLLRVDSSTWISYFRELSRSLIAHLPYTLLSIAFALYQQGY
jgi:hypothetical protein